MESALLKDSDSDSGISVDSLQAQLQMQTKNHKDKNLTTQINIQVGESSNKNASSSSCSVTTTTCSAREKPAIGLLTTQASSSAQASSFVKDEFMQDLEADNNEDDDTEEDEEVSFRDYPSPKQLLSPKRKTTSGGNASKTLPSYVSLVQEAIYSLNLGLAMEAKGDEEEGDEGGVSKVHVMLYILKKFKPSDDVETVLTKVTKALEVLTSMGAVERKSIGNNTSLDETSTSSPTNALINFPIAEFFKPTATSTAAKTAKVSSAAAKTAKISSTAAKTAKISSSNSSTVPKKTKVLTDNNKKSDTTPKAPKVKVKKEPTESTSTEAKPKKIKRKRRKSNEENQPRKSKPKKCSPALAEIVGASVMSRHDVIKNLWVYIRTHELQDKEKRTVINADEKLRKITKVKRVEQTDLLKCLKKHLEDAEPQNEGPRPPSSSSKVVKAKKLVLKKKATTATGATPNPKKRKLTKDNNSASGHQEKYKKVVKKVTAVKIEA